MFLFFCASFCLLYEWLVWFGLVWFANMCEAIFFMMDQCDLILLLLHSKDVDTPKYLACGQQCSYI